MTGVQTCALPISYQSRLNELDTQYAQAVQSAKHDTVLFGDRFPFRYLVDDYGINYYAAFAGCSSETSASFKTVVFLSGKIDELGLSKVLVIENSGEQVAKTVIENTKNKNAIYYSSIIISFFPCKHKQ